MNGLSARSLTAAARSSLSSEQLFQHDIRFTHSSDDLLSRRRGTNLPESIPQICLILGLIQETNISYRFRHDSIHKRKPQIINSISSPSTVQSPSLLSHRLFFAIANAHPEWQMASKGGGREGRRCSVCSSHRADICTLN